jgi:phospholipid-binding lipoprotein MlaA
MNKPCNGSWDSKIQRSFSGVLMGAAITLSGCATTSGDRPRYTGEVDPYENFNRKMFSFNDNVDNYVAEPISNAYKWATPQFMQTGVYNFFNNLKNINVVINDVLQAKFKQSAEDTGDLLSIQQ